MSLQASHGLVQERDHAHGVGDLPPPEHRPGLQPFDPADVDPLAAFGFNGALGQNGRAVDVGDLVADRVGQVRRGDQLELTRDQAGLLAELAVRRLLERLGLGTSAFGDFPGISLEGIAVLPDEPDAGAPRLLSAAEAEARISRLTTVRRAHPDT